MLSGVVHAEAGTSSYTLRDGQTLEVGADFDEDLSVTFRGDGRVNVRGGAELGQARFTVAANAAAADSETRVVFYRNASADEVTFVGAGGKLGLVVANNGSDLGNVIVDASSDQGNTAGRTVLNLRNGSTTEDIAFFGSLGRDVLAVAGNVATGNISADLSGGNDLVRFDNTATVQAPAAPADGELPDGQITLQLRNGNDTVVFRGGRYDNLALTTGPGNDGVYLTGDSPAVAFRGEVDILTGNGNDVVAATGITTVEATTTIETGAGDDLVRLRNLSKSDPFPLSPVRDALTIDVGSNTAQRDRVEIGGVNVAGPTEINFSGDVVIRETAANRYRDQPTLVSNGVVVSPSRPALRIAGGSSTTDAIVRLGGGSFAEGGFEYESQAKTTLVATDLKTTGAQSILTGDNDDFIRLSSGVAEAGIDVQVGGGDDRVLIDRGQETSGLRLRGDDGRNLFQVFETDFGDPADFPSLSATFGGGPTADNILQLRNVQGEPDLTAAIRGRTRIQELSAMRLGQIRIFQPGIVSGNTQDSPLSYRGNSGSFAAGISIDRIASRVHLLYNGSIGELGVTVDTTAASFADSINLVRADIAGRVDINTGGGNDRVNLFDATVEFGTFVNLGAGDDSLDNRRTDLGDRSNLNGGGGTDLIGDAGNGTVRNFEGTI